MSTITKAAQGALAELADWHWSQAATLRKAAGTSAMDKPEPGQSSLTRMADWHDAQKSIIRAALQDKAGEVQKMDTETLRSLVAGLALEIDPDADLERYPEALGFQIDMARAVMRSAQPAPVVPDGFALVPVEPTVGMLIAGMEHRTSEEQPTHEHAVWSAMLAASQQKGGQ